MFETCKAHVNNTEYEFLIKPHSSTPNEDSFLKKNLKTLDKIWKSQFEDKDDDEEE